MRSDPVEAGRQFLDELFPETRGGMVAGSVIRGDGTDTSDLDIVLITDREDAPFRASYVYQGWPIEAFVHTEESFHHYWVNDGARPSLIRMCAEGVIVRDRDGSARRVQAEARALLERGPEPLSPEQIEDRRYGLTDVLDDFTGCDRFDEGLFIAHDLAVSAADVLLRLHHHWPGMGKWVPRALAEYDPAASNRLVEALQTYYQTQNKEPLIHFAEEVLDEAGGRLFEGYYRRGTRS